MPLDPLPISRDLLTLSRQKRAQEYDIVTLRATMPLPAASDRMLVIDFPPVEANRHWVIYEITAKWQAAYGAGQSIVGWLTKVDPRMRNYGTAQVTPANGGVADTTALVDFPSRSMPLVLSVDERYLLPDGANQAGLFAAGIGESGIILPSGWWLRAILGTSGTADGAAWTRPFAPSDAEMELSIGYLEEFTLHAASSCEPGA